MICPGCKFSAGSVRLISESEAPPAEPEPGDIIVCPNCLAVIQAVGDITEWSGDDNPAVRAGGFRVLGPEDLKQLPVLTIIELVRLQQELGRAHDSENAARVPRLPLVLN